jgi:LemA protein
LLTLFLNIGVIMIFTLVAVVVFMLVAVMSTIGIYNRLVKLRNAFKNGFSQIDVQLTRRFDLIPNLVETAKGYMKHEQETLQKVIEARNQAHKTQINLSQNPADPAAMEKFLMAEKTLTSSMGSFMAIAESYPDLKADSTMKTLMEELTSTENKVSFARQFFNDAVTEYNTARELFPNSLLAGMFNFTEAKLFEVEDQKVRQAIKVQF